MKVDRLQDTVTFLWPPLQGKLTKRLLVISVLSLMLLFGGSSAGKEIGYSRQPLDPRNIWPLVNLSSGGKRRRRRRRKGRYIVAESQDSDMIAKKAFLHCCLLSPLGKRTNYEGSAGSDDFQRFSLHPRAWRSWSLRNPLAISLSWP